MNKLASGATRSLKLIAETFHQRSELFPPKIFWLRQEAIYCLLTSRHVFIISFLICLLQLFLVANKQNEENPHSEMLLREGGIKAVEIALEVFERVDVEIDHVA